METTSETRDEAEVTVQEQSPVVPMPVSVPPVEGGEEEKKMKVIVAIDESDGSFYALEWTLDNLFTSSGAIPDQIQELRRIILVHVQQPFQHYIYPAGPGMFIHAGLAAPPAIYPTSAVVESVRKAQEQNSALLLSRALQICKERLIKAETLILDGDPKDMICQAAEQIHADLLVVGSRGLGKIKRAFLGSVSDYCAHHAKCPVLIVKPPKCNQSEGSKEK